VCLSNLTRGVQKVKGSSVAVIELLSDVWRNTKIIF
jgi:hypothetical protein